MMRFAVLSALLLVGGADAGTCYNGTCGSYGYGYPSSSYGYSSYNYGGDYSVAYANGYEDGYTYRNGYWWLDGRSYTREKVYNPVQYYYYCGRWYPYAQTWYYSYTLCAQPVAVTVTPTVSYNSTDKFSKLLDIAQDRSRAELEMRKQAVDQSAFLEAVNALGMNGNFRIEGFGQGVLYPGALGYNNHAYRNTFGAQADSLYGYTYNQVKEAYGETNMNTLYQQAAQLTKGAQALAGQAHSEFQGVVQSTGDNQARVAEILAKAQAAKIALDAANPQPVTRTTTSQTVTGTNPGTVGTVGGTAPVDEDMARFMRDVAKPACAGCHSGATPKGKFLIDSWPSLNRDRKDSILSERIFTMDPQKRMPRTMDGHVGVLSLAQRAAFASH